MPTKETPASLHTQDSEKLYSYSQSYPSMTMHQAQKILAMQREGITQHPQTILQAMVITGDGVNVR